MRILFDIVRRGVSDGALQVPVLACSAFSVFTAPLGGNGSWLLRFRFSSPQAAGRRFRARRLDFLGAVGAVFFAASRFRLLRVFGSGGFAESVTVMETT